MAIETELKLTAPAHALQKLSRQPWLRAMAIGRGKKERLVSVYFDTPDCKLEHRHIALRIRRQAGKRMQTIKAQDGANALSRAEWEHPVSSNRPHLGPAKGTPLEPLLKNGAKKMLRPMFETNIERTTIPLRAGHSEVELAIDRGFIRAGKRRVSVHEIELELKHGDSRDLAALAGRLAESEQVAYGALTKAERGYALKAGRHQQPVEAGAIALDPAQSVASAFAKIGLSCLHHLSGNEPAVRKGDSEGVHQMRVGLRRLRAAISVFKEIATDERTEAIKDELKWLTEQLGPARDFDVMIEDALHPLRDEQQGKPEIKLLQSDVEEKREEGFAKAKAAVASERYRKLVLDTALWLIAGPWSRREDALAQAALQRQVDGFAPDVLRKRRKKIVKKSRKADELDALGRHKLRIAVKKLRYSTEFFASLFAGNKQKSARERIEDLLKTLQDALGTLNDIAMHDKFADQMVRGGKRTKNDLQKTYAMGLLSGSEHRLAGACIAKAKKTGEKLAAAKPFWR
ncbi:MAG TPA: CHAD domain-containing protein [Rhizomicrobium sp.]|nr:CHAD domain-containing protein [Rhizomicrobium sp.]